MHDTVWFELEGLPSVFVASSVFARAWLEDVQCVFVPHPIQDATDAEMRAKADSVVESVLRAIGGAN